MSCNNNTKISAKKLYHQLSKKKNDIASRAPIYIYQKDFKDGTYIIDNPGHYVLQENIIFSPNPDNDYLPKKDNVKYSTLGYSLGFFACLVIATKDVYLNLNGHSISASPEFVLQQRFFSIIELADSPFLPNEGPGKFSIGIKAAENVVIANGRLGKSSHHGIHGNLANNILLEKLEITDFEFVGIALNGGHCIVLKDINVHHNKQDIPVLATYSAARFAKLFTNYILHKDILTVEDEEEIKYRLAILQKEMDQTFQEVVSGKRVSSDLFRNDTKLPDGNIYGVLIKNEGFAINDFVNTTQVNKEKRTKTSNVFLYNVDVKDLKCRVDEIIGLSAKGGTGFLMDVAGSILQIDKIVGQNKYVGTNLSNLQLHLSKISIDYKIPLGKNNIPFDVLYWANEQQDISTLLSKGYKYKCGGDSMAHFSKGAISFRFDALSNVLIKRCNTENIINTGYLGNDKIAGNYIRSHDQAKRDGYFGADTTGVNISFCSDVKILKSRFVKTISHHGRSIGINVIFGSDISVEKTKIEHIKAGSLVNNKWKGQDYNQNLVDYSNKMPNKIPQAIGIRLEKDCLVEIDKVDINDLKSPETPVKILRL